MKAPDKGLTMEKSAVKASRNVEKEEASIRSGILMRPRARGRRLRAGRALRCLEHGLNEPLRSVTVGVRRQPQAHDDQLARLDDADALAVVAGHPKGIRRN